VLGGTLTEGVTPADGDCSLGDSLGPPAGGVTMTPSPQVRSRYVAVTGEPATSTDPVDTVRAAGSTAYHALPVFPTSPLGRRTVSDSGRNAPLVLAVSTSSRPATTPTVPCAAWYRPVSLQSRPTVVCEPPQSTATEPPEKVSRPVDPAGTSIDEPSPT